ncbi:MAG: nucleotidyltransferase domain-containing protein [Oscillospiraceae bacterium]|nr:nucleotidyltransferase domain-containing protein [Oscillospiraceae bacterium]
MRTEIPKNNSGVDYEKILGEFVDTLKEKQGGNLLSVYLAGSYARGDGVANSDLDIFCIFDEINSGVLSDVGFCARNNSVSYESVEINSQCMSIAEFKSDEFNAWSERSVRALDSVLVYGEDLCGVPDKVEIETAYKKYAAEIVMSIRHYIAVDEPKEKLTHGKIKTYILKPLMFALRLEIYCKKDIFPLSGKELLEACGSDKKFLAEYFYSKEKFDKDISENHKDVFEKIHSAVCSML